MPGDHRTLPAKKNVDHRQALEAFLHSDEQPTLNEIARRLGCPVTTLMYRYPELCRAITRQNRSVLDIGAIGESLQEALQCRKASFPTVTDISKQFGCSASVLYHHFSELCYELTKKHKDYARSLQTSGTKARNISNSKAAVSVDETKHRRKHLGMENVDRIRKELENLLKNGVDRPMTMTELANRFGCARCTLRRHFPDQCDKLMKKREKEEYLNRLRLSLEEALICDVASAGSVDRLARQLGCSSATLRHYFPDLCKSISQRYMGLTDVEMQRNALEVVMRSGDQTNLSVNEIARRLGCANSTLYSRFPELCKSLVKRRWQATDIDGMQKTLEAVLENVNEPPPTLKEISELLKCSEKNLEYYFPELCRAITERRRQLSGLSRFRVQLEAILANDNDPVSVLEVARRLGCSDSSLRQCFPELCNAISARYRTHRKLKGIEKIRSTCDEVRQIVLRLHAQGEYPAYDKVQALVTYPGYFWRIEVRDAWKDARRELGL